MPIRARKAIARQKANDHDSLKVNVHEDLIGTLPKEVGVLLIIVGLGGILLPGPIGSPFLLLGGVTLWPSAFGKLEAAFRNRFPKLHREGMRQVKRFLADLDRRYPAPE
jgi:hypothetical protein